MILDRPKTGTYIGVEGVGGVGKTYFEEKLDEETRMKLVPEVPQSGLGQDILETIANDDEFFRHGSPVVEGLLFYAMKEYSIEKEVVPNLQAGRTVIQDRPFYSTSIYTAIIASRHHDKTAEDLFFEFNALRESLTFRPDLNIYLYDKFENCLDRIERREQREFQDDEIKIMKQMYSFYEELSDQYPTEFHRINVGEHSDREVLNEMKAAINSVE